MSILDVQHIEKNFGATKVLKDINFSLDEGQVLAIIGSSGSGKTTLLRCLNFLETPNTGRIVVRGRRSSTPPTPPPSRRRRSAASACTSAWSSRASTSSPSTPPWKT